MLSNTKKRRFGVRYAAKNNLDYRQVYSATKEIQAFDEAELLFQLDRRFKK